MLSAISDFFHKHEKLIIAGMVLFVVLYLGNKWINSSAANAEQRATIAEASLAEHRREDQQRDEQAKQMLDKYAALVQDLNNKNNELAKQIVQRDAETKKQQEIDKTLPLPDLAVRWQQLAQLNKDDLKATIDGITVNDTGSRKTVQMLEEVPGLQANVQAKDQIIANKTAENVQANATINSLQAQVSGLKETSKQQDVTCKAEKDSIKADARKSKRNWFVAGAATATAIVLRFIL